MPKPQSTSQDTETKAPVDPTAPPDTTAAVAAANAQAAAETAQAKVEAQAEIEAAERDRLRAEAALKAKTAGAYEIIILVGGNLVTLGFDSPEELENGRQNCMRMRGTAPSDPFPCSINGRRGLFYPITINAVFQADKT